MLNLIVAMDEANGIGKDGDIPWLGTEEGKADLKFFRDTTLNSVVVMGRKTYESIVAKLGHPLSGRTSIVWTSRTDTVRTFDDYDVQPFSGTAEELYKKAISIKYKNTPHVIGGARTYKALIPFVDVAIITTISGDWDCDTKFDLDLSEWVISAATDNTVVKIKK